MKHPEVIGVDLGGTAIKLGRFLTDGTCVESMQIPTPQPATPEAVIDVIVATVIELNRQYNCVALGIGMPGPADASARIAIRSINLPGWYNIPLADALEAQTGLPTTIANDANCAGVGEAWLGAGKNYHNFILLTLGTGVGGAIFIDGKLFTGHQGASGELGLVTLNPDGPPCNSGNNGSLEQYVSAVAIRRTTGKEAKELGELAAAGDVEALSFWQDYGKLLAAGLTSSIYVLSPEAVVIGGGVSASSKFFLPTTKAEIDRRVMPSSRVDLQVLVAQLGNRAGMLGAAKLAWQLYQKNIVNS